MTVLQLIQDRFVPTVERSLIDQLVPARDVGVMIHGQKIFDNRLDYGFSVYGGVINGDSDNDRNKDLAARVAVRPFQGGEFGDFWKGLQLGMAGTIGDDRGPIQATTYRTPANVPWFVVASGTKPDGIRYRWSPELALPDRKEERRSGRFSASTAPKLAHRRRASGAPPRAGLAGGGGEHRRGARAGERP